MGGKVGSRSPDCGKHESARRPQAFSSVMGSTGGQGERRGSREALGAGQAVRGSEWQAGQEWEVAGI